MTWREPDRPHRCSTPECERGTADPDAPCWAHAPQLPPEPTALGRDLGVRPGSGNTVYANTASAAMAWTPFAATLQTALERRSRPERRDASP